MTTKPEAEIFTLEFRPLGNDDRPPHVRLRRLLKFALRACNLRCLGVSSSKPHDSDHATPEGKPDQSPAGN